MRYCEIQSLFDTLMPHGQYRSYWKSHYLRGLEDFVIDEIVEGNANPPSPHTLSSIWNFGGTTARVGATDTAFGERSMPYMFSLDSTWEGAERDAVSTRTSPARSDERTPGLRVRPLEDPRSGSKTGLN